MALTSSKSFDRNRTPLSDIPPSRITLEDILSDQSPRPYTFNALLDFLTQNHCIETLDFISEAKNYRHAYGVYLASTDNHNHNIVQDPTFVTKQWRRLIATYIFPGSPNEINLPSYIQDALLGIVDVTGFPPSPEELNPAINHAYEILIEDALIPFIGSFHLAENQPINTAYLPGQILCPSNLGQPFSRVSSTPKQNDL